MNAKTTGAASKPLYATREFNDIGTGKTFAYAEPIDADPGELANYKAAGLASETKPGTKAAEAGSDAA